MEDQTDVLGRRIGAGLIDLLILFVLFLVLALAIGDSDTSGSSVSVNLQGVGAIVYVLLVLLYYGALEAMAGQTVGKRVLGIRVVSTDGTPAGAGQVALRTLLRLVDGLLLYLVAVIAIAVTGKRRARLGDLAGRTAVVRA